MPSVNVIYKSDSHCMITYISRDMWKPLCQLDGSSINVNMGRGGSLKS